MNKQANPVRVTVSGGDPAARTAALLEIGRSQVGRRANWEIIEKAPTHAGVGEGDQTLPPQKLEILWDVVGRYPPERREKAFMDELEEALNEGTMNLSYYQVLANDELTIPQLVTFLRYRLAYVMFDGEMYNIRVNAEQPREGYLDLTLQKIPNCPIHVVRA